MGCICIRCCCISYTHTTQRPLLSQVYIYICMYIHTYFSLYIYAFSHPRTELIEQVSDCKCKETGREREMLPFAFFLVFFHFLSFLSSSYTDKASCERERGHKTLCLNRERKRERFLLILGFVGHVMGDRDLQKE